MYKKEQELYN